MTGYGPRTATFRALGCAVVVGAPTSAHLGEAVEVARREIAACDAACSRFRPDSELSRLNAGIDVGVASEWFCQAVSTALDAARATDGLVDPTIGRCLIDLGYDRSFDRLDATSRVMVTASHVPAWHKVTVDEPSRNVRLPAGVVLDLGATAKALCADRAATAAAAATGAGVLVGIGGDIAVAGPAPDAGWDIAVTDRTEASAAAPTDQTINIRNGGLATSGTTARRWSRAGTTLHHLVDPRTGWAAAEVWRTASVAAPTCVAANTASTAAILLGHDAPGWLGDRGFDARLVSVGGEVLLTGAWPEDLRGAA